MIDGVNRVSLMGRVYDRPLRRKAKGQRLIKVTLSVDEPKFADGEWSARTSYHTVAIFGSLADVFDGKLDVDVFIYVEGRLHHFPYKDAEGGQHFRTEVIAQRIVITPYQEQEEQKPEPEPQVEPGDHPDELTDEDIENMRKVVPLFPKKEEGDEEVDEDLLPF